MTLDLVIRSRRAVLPNGEAAAAVGVQDGRIAVVVPYGTRLDTLTDLDLGDTALLPGMVDTHVHVNEPGRTHWEGFASATRAAAAGGVTTVVDMPLNSVPPTTDAAALAAKQAAARDVCHIDVGFWGGVVPGNAADLPELRAAGVFGFKAFLTESGVPEFPPVTVDELTVAAMAVPGALFLVHAEDPDMLRDPVSGRYGDFLASRPPVAEASAIAAVTEVSRRTGARMHILHVSAGAGVEAIAAAQHEGLAVTGETCPHYLTLTADDVSDGATEFKCCPPIRSWADQDALWGGLRAGVISCIVSDHSPSPPELKAGGFDQAWGGIASVQLSLPAVWTEAARRGAQLPDVVRWQSANTSALVGLHDRGAIRVSARADLVAFDADAWFTVDSGDLLHRHPVTPYAGRRLRGVVRQTWLAGRPVGGDRPAGQLVTARAASAALSAPRPDGYGSSVDGVAGQQP
ncbi:allantoinase AllB [Micromonospora echinofusca]|uniref:allantoinase n=1 Tax=Micromonospora echinofusca TaxID=47858 RepID=A0ABS3VIU0_MICEH|nr:allantoinase AllB [Micromonospora echinofusca]MBO4204436.1 allantoinase AllB [Micromonospora echinofusca]